MSSFTPKNNKIEIIRKALSNEKVLDEIKKMTNLDTVIYIDSANVIGWERRLKFKIDWKKFYNFFTSFDNVVDIKFYIGTMKGDRKSENFVKNLPGLGYNVITKDVKIIRKSTKTSDIDSNNPVRLKDFIRNTLLRQLKLSTIETLNYELSNMYNAGIEYLEDRKCNFDVEISCDMVLDKERDIAKNFILMSGDSDFKDTLERVCEQKDNCASMLITSGIVAHEFNELKNVFKFDIKKIKNYICKPKYMDESIKNTLKNAKGAKNGS